MHLSDTVIRQAKPGPKPIKMFDGRGLFLLLTPAGSRCWRFKYRIDGREKLLALGVYPDVSLKRARDRREEARQSLANGVDPGAQRQTAKALRANTFEAIAREWLTLQEQKLAAVTLSKANWMLESFIFPTLGSRPIAKISAPDLLAALRKIEARGTHETAHRAKQLSGQVFRYAIATGRAEHDISAYLRGALAPVVTKNHAAVTDPSQVGELVRAINDYQGNCTTTFALKISLLTFVRPGELRHAEWSEFNLDNAEWCIPGTRMKMGEQHIVPLSRQATALLQELRSINGHSRYVFPSLRSATRPMSENTVNAALRRLGYTKDEMTGHGFRSLASTLLNEQGWHPDLIELQLAHAERNKVRAAYNRAQRLVERRKMMQAWADYLATLAAGAQVVSMPSAHAA